MNRCSASNPLLDTFAPKPSCISPSLLPQNDRRPKFLFLGRFGASNSHFQRVRGTRRLRINGVNASSNSSSKPADSSQQLFESLKEAEKERMNKLEEFERKANVQLERQLMMASEWSRTLLTMKGKLKGTEWDPVTSHSIDYSDFKRLLDSNNVRFMEYSNYGQTVSGWTSS